MLKSDNVFAISDDLIRKAMAIKRAPFIKSSKIEKYNLFNLLVKNHDDL